MKRMGKYLPHRHRMLLNCGSASLLTQRPKRMDFRSPAAVTGSILNPLEILSRRTSDTGMALYSYNTDRSGGTAWFRDFTYR